MQKSTTPIRLDSCRSVTCDEQLRQEHTHELDELVQQAGASGGLGGVGAREMVGELNERINILMAENTVMADQVYNACFSTLSALTVALQDGRS